MAYGDRLQVRVRATGDFRIETKPEFEIDEIGLVVDGSIELSLDELHEVLEQDTRGIPVRSFDGHQRYVDAGADGGMLDFLVNVASDVTMLGLSGTIGYISGKLRGWHQSGSSNPSSSFTDSDFERAAIDAIRVKFGVAPDEVCIQSVETGIDGRGSVELTTNAGSRKFRIDLELHRNGLRVYRVKRTEANPS